MEGNTVGSQEIVLTVQQRSLIIGSLLGDGSLYRNGRYPCFRADHGFRQEAYLRWKYRVLENLTTRPPVIVGSYHPKTGKLYQRWHFSTTTSPSFEWLFHLFYPKGRKVVPKEIAQYMTPDTLAVWYMDDGHKRTDCNALRIHTNAYAVHEVHRLQEIFQRTFGIETRAHHIRRGIAERALYIPSGKNTRRFIEIVRPYVHASMQYKISLTP